MARRLSDPVPFSELPPSLLARVVSVHGLDPVQADRLGEMGLLPGTQFTVTKIAPLGDPVEIELRGYRLCLRRAETAGMMVEVLDP